jgi:hypothetical protein
LSLPDLILQSMRQTRDFGNSAWTHDMGEQRDGVLGTATPAGDE